MERSELEQRFTVLRDRFCAASDKWPNLESILITWPEGQPPLENLPAELDGQYAIAVPCPDSDTALWICTLVGGIAMDTPAQRYRTGCAGQLVLRRSFGKLFGNPREIADPDESHACGERFKVLATDGAEHLAVVGSMLGLSRDSLKWLAWTRWQLAVHETIGPTTRELAGGYRYEKLADVFMASAQAIDCWRNLGIAPGKITVDIARGTVTVDGQDYPAEPHHCAVVQALINEGGRNITSSQLSELHGCAGKNWTREFKTIKDKIPALADRIKSDGNKGYRILDF